MEEINNYQAATLVLGEMDTVLGKVIAEVGELEPLRQADYFKALAQKIISQQLSVKAASTIRKRMEMMIDDRYLPDVMNKFSQADYRAVGVSRQKFGYLQDLCQSFINDPGFYDSMDEFSDEEVVAKLVEIKGIGEWTAQMFLMSTLGRMDVFAPADVGLQNAIYKLYGIEGKMNKKELVSFAERWAPYRSLASRYLWASLDNEPG